jgi:signal transduction histidine kinase
MSSFAQTLQTDLITAAMIALAAVALGLLRHARRLRAGLTRLEVDARRERRQRKLAEQALAGLRVQLCQLLAERDHIKEAERRRIARDIHDDLGQHLTAMRMDLNAQAARHPTLTQPFALLDAHLKQSLGSLRTILRDLVPEALECGLRRAVEQQLTQFSRLSGIPCQLHAEAAAFSAQADPRMDTMLFRVLQESLSNIARHAQATQVQIALCRQAGQLNLTVRDNGVGLARPAARRGFGLRGMEERVTEAGGHFLVSSRPGCGTALSISFPLELAPHQAENASPAAQ